MSREGDIAAIRRRYSDRYHREGSCMVAGLSEEGHGSKCFAGDAQLMLDLLSDMVGDVISKSSENQDEMEALTRLMRRSITTSARHWWKRDHPEEDVSPLMDAVDRLMN